MGSKNVDARDSLVVIPKYLFISYTAFGRSRFFSGQYLISDLGGEVTTNKFYINFCLFKS